MVVPSAELIPVKALLLDHDDTGIITRATEYERMRHVGRLHGTVLTDALLDKSWGMAFEEQLVFLYPGVAVEELTLTYSALGKAYRRSPNDGYLSLLQSCRTAGMPYGIVSSHNADLIRGELVEIGDDPSLHQLIHGSKETHPYRKPAKETFDPALALLAEDGISAQQVAYIGDDTRDCEAALAAGMQFVGVTTGIHQLEHFRDAGAKYAVYSLREIGVRVGALIVPKLLPEVL